MCTISNDIILCTCEVENASKLKDYWQVYRHDPSRGIHIIGSVYYQYETFDGLDPNNSSLILEKLTNDTLFDQPFTFYERDRLKIQLRLPQFKMPIIYGFEFRGGRWEALEFDEFTWLEQHTYSKKKLIKNAFL